MLAARAEMHDRGLDSSARISGALDELAGLVSLLIEVRLTPEGGARITGEGHARDEGSARAAALRMNARIAAMADSVLVRVALRGVLSGFAARSQGDTIDLELPVSPPQMDAVLSLVGAHVGALRGVRPGREPRDAGEHDRKLLQGLSRARTTRVSSRWGRPSTRSAS